MSFVVLLAAMQEVAAGTITSDGGATLTLGTSASATQSNLALGTAGLILAGAGQAATIENGAGTAALNITGAAGATVPENGAGVAALTIAAAGVGAELATAAGAAALVLAGSGAAALEESSEASAGIVAAAGGAGALVAGGQGDALLSIVGAGGASVPIAGDGGAALPMASGGSGGTGLNGSSDGAAPIGAGGGSVVPIQSTQLDPVRLTLATEGMGGEPLPELGSVGGAPLSIDMAGSGGALAQADASTVLELFVDGDASVSDVEGEVGGGIGAIISDRAAWAQRARELEAQRRVADRRQVPERETRPPAPTVGQPGVVVGSIGGGAFISIGCAGTTTTEPWLSDEELLAIVMAA